MRLPASNKIFDTSLSFILNVVIAYIIVVLNVGLIRTLLGMKRLFGEGDLRSAYNEAIIEILTFLVIIELFKGFVEYFKNQRISLTIMIDSALVFVIRELLVSLYTQGHTEWHLLASFGILVLCLGIVRTLAVRYSPQDAPRQG
ncbi:uncharacterized membrane protein (DUF373 family) [Desulfobaculum xiamenense]|uniref:Uncharacterized membrane protein (DUF373 family) n=1 Tax=Desulfobaculum xiamenense TaxID=995050 RepID=A0A846QQV7_9BACT|nr:phosphate-starvation-inducible PsiE family protein [Desulfobaculum xiamenense]NJB69370.1 uncharacterized membrane protein (DUF373 family) [Desulfobaculum xiamenense]